MRESERNPNTPSVCKMSKVHNSNILGLVLCLKLKLTEFVVTDVEQTKRQYLHPNATDSPLNTTTATKAKSTIINSTATTTTTATAITTGVTTTVTKSNGISQKFLGISEVVLSQINTNYVQTVCQEDVSVMIRNDWWY